MTFKSRHLTRCAFPSRACLGWFLAVATLMAVDVDLRAADAAEFWLKPKGDKSGGSGTKADPWVVLSAEEFDAKMRQIPAGARIHLQPGVFETLGWGSAEGKGFAVKSGWHIIGAGTDRTVIRLLDCVKDATPSSGVGRVLFSGWASAVENVVIQDLTADCNYDGIRKRLKRDELSLEGVRLFGREFKVQRVKVINAVGKRNLPNATPESFIIALSPKDETTDATGYYVEDSEVSSFHGGQCTAISILGTGGKAGATGAFRRNRVLLQGGPGEFAFSGYGARDLLIEGNTTVRATRVFNWDTAAPGGGILIRSNQFLKCPGWAFTLGGGSNSVIENNLIELLDSRAVGIQISAKNRLFPGAGPWTIRNNVFKAVSGSPIAFRFFNVEPVPGCVFEGNILDRRLKIDPSARGLKSFKGNVNDRGRGVPPVQ